MDEMLIFFSLVFNRWRITPTPPSELMDDFVVVGCTVPVFPSCSGTCCTALATRGPPTYRGRPYRHFRLGCCKVHVDIPAHPTDPTITAWFTTARGDDIDDTLERATYQALMEFCERHLPVLNDTAIALLPVQNENNAVWSERVAAVGDPELLTHHAG
jgi:hypothetical protein